MDILSAVLSIGILIYSAILHEIAHGFIAYRLGDPTAKVRGRLTLNPIPHIDPVMSVLVPFILIISGSPIIFGGAKPVPVDPFNLRDGRKDLALVSLVGPLTNLSIAIIASILIHLFFPGFTFISTLQNGGIPGYILAMTVLLNLVLMIFNLVPIPPLDGSKVFSLLLPPKEAAAYLSLGSIGMFILIFLLFFPIGGLSLIDIVWNLVLFLLSLLGL